MGKIMEFDTMSSIKVILVHSYSPVKDETA